MENTGVNTQPERNTPIYIGDWLVDPASGRLSRGTQEARIEPRAMDVLLYLVSHQGEVCSRDEIESVVWEGMVVGYDSLASAVIKLRKAFGDNSRDPTVIETVSKRGYRLIAPVRLVDETYVADENPVSPVITPEVKVDREVTRSTSSLPVQHRNHLAVYSIVVVFLLATFYLLYLLGVLPMETTLEKPGVGVEKPSLVVLPFANGNNKEQEYFSDGITDDLINDLSQYSNLNVIARRSAYIYKKRNTDIQTIARELGVTYIVDGDVRHDGQKLRLNVQLIDATSGANIWSQRFDRNTEDIFAVQDDIRKNILNALSITLTAEERNRAQVRYTSSFEAYDLFLQGQAKLVSRSSAADSVQAQELMEKAIKLDPDFARAYAALAYILSDANRLGWTSDPEKTRHDALAAGQRAIALDPKLYQAYWIMGNVYLFLFKEYDKAIEMAEQAVKLSPNSNDGLLTLAVTYAYGGNPAKAVLISGEIMQHNRTYSSLVPAVLGQAQYALGNYPAALAAYNKSLEINPAYINANVYKISILYRMGREDDALFQADELFNLHPNIIIKEWASRQPYKDKSIIKNLLADLAKLDIEK